MRHLYFFIAVVLTSLMTLAQTPPKHHRALELEKNVYQDLQGTLRDLLLDQPFLLKVSIDPIHRQSSSTNTKENLPYFEATEEIKDEWDDPNRSDFELIRRVNRISVKVTLSDSLSKEQLSEVKQAVINRIPFVEGRDLVEVETKSWPVQTDHSSYTRWILTIGVVLLLILGVVYFLVSSVSVAKLSRAIKAIKVSTGELGSGSAFMPQSATSAGPSAPSSGNNRDALGGSQLQINDTIRMTEVIIDLIKNFEDSKSFPTLDDMILINSFFERHPKSAGALVAEFPKELKEHLFSMSSSEAWLAGLTHPGELDSVSFELMNRLMRSQRDPSLTKWNHFLILAWRLGPKLISFLKTIDSNDRLTILRALPQSLAIGVARELMPGEWAAVLKKSGENEVLDALKIARYEKLCLELLPLKSFTHLEQYKKDTDLIHFLRTVDPTLEREIYGAAGGESNLMSLRPPFYAVLEATNEDLKRFQPQVALEDWSLALMNLPKKARMLIETNLSDKQKFHLLELLKRNDRSNLSAETIGLARERIGRQFQQYLKSQAVKPEAHQGDLDEDQGHSTSEAA